MKLPWRTVKAIHTGLILIEIFKHGNKNEWIVRTNRNPDTDIFTFSKEKAEFFAERILFDGEE